MDIDIKFPDIKHLKLDRYAKIVSYGIGLPDRIVSNQHIIEEYKVFATDRAVQYSLGIKERRWSNLDETLEELMAKAVKQCLDKACISIEQVDRVIYTKLLGDRQVPAISVGLLKQLGASVGIPAFDISAACSGFIHTMDLAIKYINSGDEYVLVIGGTLSSAGLQRWKKPNHKSIFLFGDGIAAMLIGKSEVQHFLASYIFTNPYLYDSAMIPYGTSTLGEEPKEVDYDMFNMRIPDGNIIQESSVEYAKVISEKLLNITNLTMEEIDFFVTSDQSTKIWEAQIEALGIPKEKSVSNFYTRGNTVGAMSPFNLFELIDSGRLKRGDTVMMQAHGAGASSGGMIFKY